MLLAQQQRMAALKQQQLVNLLLQTHMPQMGLGVPNLMGMASAFGASQMPTSAEQSRQVSV
jgi:hypothetical protein